MAWRICLGCEGETKPFENQQNSSSIILISVITHYQHQTEMWGKMFTPQIIFSFFAAAAATTVNGF
jgi:hypothetical protein